MARGHRDPAAWHPADRFDHALFGIVEPVFGVSLQHLPSDVRTQLKEGLLPDAHSAQGCEIVAPPLLGHADAQAAHADNVVDIPIVLLNPDRMKDQRSFLIDVAGVAHVGGRQRIAAVGLVSLGKNRQPMHALLVDDRHHGTIVGGMRIAVIGRIVKEGVAAFEMGMVGQDFPRDDVRADHDMDRQALGCYQQATVGREHDAREVVGGVKNAGSAGSEQSVLHSPRDGLQTICDERHPHAICSLLSLVSAGFQMHRNDLR